LTERRHTPKEKREMLYERRFLRVKSSFSMLIKPIHTSTNSFPRAHAVDWMN
jgi:hypothetical protein